MDEHLAGKLFSNVEEPNLPWTFRGLSLPFVDEREDDEETQQALDYLDGCVARVLDGVRMGAIICTYEGGWAEETTGAFVDIGEVDGGVWGCGW